MAFRHFFPPDVAFSTDQTGSGKGPESAEFFASEQELSHFFQQTQAKLSANASDQRASNDAR
jgi:hypothetical protein